MTLASITTKDRLDGQKEFIGRLKRKGTRLIIYSHYSGMSPFRGTNA